jgi:hypothetical protein
MIAENTRRVGSIRMLDSPFYMTKPRSQSTIARKPMTAPMMNETTMASTAAPIAQRAHRPGFETKCCRPRVKDEAVTPRSASSATTCGESSLIGRRRILVGNCATRLFGPLREWRFKKR